MSHLLPFLLIKLDTEKNFIQIHDGRVEFILQHWGKSPPCYRKIFSNILTNSHDTFDP